MKLRLIGSGDAFSSGGRYTACIMVETRDGTMLLDLGFSSFTGLKQAGFQSGDVDAVLLSHLHGDHCGAVPSFIIDALYNEPRTKPLVIEGPNGTRMALSKALETAYPGTEQKEWPFDFVIGQMRPEEERHICGLRVHPYEMAHSGDAVCLGYRIEAENHTIAYTGDTGWTDRLIPLADGADILIIDCSYWKKGPPNHLSYEELSEKASQLNAKHIILTHMGPQVLANLDQIDAERFIPAYDGMIIELDARID